MIEFNQNDMYLPLFYNRLFFRTVYTFLVIPALNCKMLCFIFFKSLIVRKMRDFHIFLLKKKRRIYNKDIFLHYIN